MDVWAYYNQADEVELWLNGESLGIRQKTDSTYHVSWRVPFQPGTLTAVSRKEGKEVLRQEIHTAGAPAALRLTTDRETLPADGETLAFVTVDVVDAEGNLVPDATNRIRFSLTEGTRKIVGTDNGDPNDPESLSRPERRAYYGKALVVVRGNRESGTLTLRAEAEGLPEATLRIAVD